MEELVTATKPEKRVRLFIALSMNGGARDILQERKKMKDREIYDGH